ncbi:MAG: DNA primase, partial [Paeniglutamicibacter sp.]
PTGADPCDLRQTRGPEAVRELIDSKRPLFEFAIKAGLKNYNLNTVEGRVQALRVSAPIVAGIRDSAIRPAYARELAGWLGMDMEDVNRAVGASVRRNRMPKSAEPLHGNAGHATQEQPAAPVYSRPDPRDPVSRMEREALEVVLQQPAQLTAEQWQAFYDARFMAPAHAAVHDAVRAAGLSGATPSQWVEAIRQEVPEPLRSFVSELAVTPLPASTTDALLRYCNDIINRLFELQITHLKAEKMGELQRMDPEGDPEGFQRINRELLELELRRRALRQE